MEIEFEKKTRAASEVDGEKWVYDSSIDNEGRTPLRASTGAWKASLFIIGMDFLRIISSYAAAAVPPFLLFSLVVIVILLFHSSKLCLFISLYNSCWRNCHIRLILFEL